MKNVGSSKKIFSFNAVTAKECIERFKNVFDKYCVASDIELIHYSSGHISAVAPPLKYPVIIETKNYCFCLHAFEEISAENISLIFLYS